MANPIDEEEIAFNRECDRIEHELDDIDLEFARLDNLFNRMNEEAQQGHYIKGIAQFTKMLPDAIALVRRMISLEKRIDKFREEKGI